jgi:hypothetical protein
MDWQQLFVSLGQVRLFEVKYLSVNAGGNHGHGFIFQCIRHM